MTGTDSVISGMVVVAVMTTTNDAVKGKPPSLRQGIGLFAATFLLTVLAEPAPQIAAGLSTLAAVTSIFVFGGPAFTALTKATK